MQNAQDNANYQKNVKTIRSDMQKMQLISLKYQKRFWKVMNTM